MLKLAKVFFQRTVHKPVSDLCNTLPQPILALHTQAAKLVCMTMQTGSRRPILSRHSTCAQAVAQQI